MLTLTFLAGRARASRSTSPTRRRARPRRASRFAGAGIISTFGITIVRLAGVPADAGSRPPPASRSASRSASAASRRSASAGSPTSIGLVDALWTVPPAVAARRRAVRAPAGARRRPSRVTVSGALRRPTDGARTTCSRRSPRAASTCSSIGGGIVGCAVAWLGARAGLSVALVERGDLAGATSSASSKLIHGGLRYLQMGDIGLVREAHAERHALARTVAPHLVRPRAFLVPVYRGGPVRATKLRAGLVLYGGLGRFADGGGSLLRPRAARALVPPLRTAGLRSAGRYVDHETNDARHDDRRRARRGACRRAHRDARRGGERCGSRAGASRAPSARTCSAAAALGSRARPASSTRPGPWVDEMRRMADPAAPRSLRFAKGAHLIVRLDEPWERRADDAARGRARAVREPLGGRAARRHDRRALRGRSSATSRSRRGRHRADRARVARVDRAGRRRARPHPLELRGRARAAAGRRRDAVGAPRDRLRARRGGHALDRRRQVHDVQAHRARRPRAAARRPRPAGARARARAVARRSRSRRRGRAPAARPSRRSRSRARATSRASTAATRSSCSRPRARIRRCSSRSRPGAPEVAAQVRWAREREWALTADDVLARRTTLAALGRAEDARARVAGAAAMTARYVAALDQGTTSSRCLLFDERGTRRSRAAQQEHRQITPRPGWVEHDADEILAALRARASTRRSRRPGARRRRRGGDRHRQPARDGRAVGARERAPARERDRVAGHAQRRARGGARRRSTASARRPGCRSRPTSPAPSSRGCSTSCRARAPAPRPASSPPGTIDSWLAWHLAGVHVTDATNASRTLLMDLAHARLGRRPARRDRRPARRCWRGSGPRAASSARSAACRSPHCSATSRQRSSGSAASTPG